MGYTKTGKMTSAADTKSCRNNYAGMTSDFSVVAEIKNLTEEI
jgi:hypothetical protein